MTRQEAFEAHWADMHDVQAESMAQYRWADKDGYRLPGIAVAYRNFCAGWDESERVAMKRMTITEAMRQSIPFQSMPSAMRSTSFAYTRENKK